MALRILLLNAPFHRRFSRSQRSPARTKSGNLYYPIWLGYATGALEQAGHRVLLLDAPAQGLSQNQTVAAAVTFRPDLVVTDTTTPSIVNDLSVTQAIRTAVPNAFQVLVGTHASALPEETLRDAPWIDAIARREYDQTLIELANCLECGAALDSVSGITYRVDNDLTSTAQTPEMTSAQLDNLPFVSDVWKRHVRVQDYFYSITPHPQITLVTGRGCPYKCEFCVWPQVLTGHGYRRRSIENVVEEFAWIGRNLPGVHVFIEDDTLTVNKKRCHSLSEALIASGNKVGFTANARADVDYDTLAILKRAGMRMVCTGFESADDGILGTVQKQLNLDGAVKFAENAKKAKVLVHGCFMVGNPGENRKTLRATLDFAMKINPDSAQFFPLMVYPGTTAYDRAKDDGSLLSQDWSRWLTSDGMHNTVIEQPGLPPSELVAWCDNARREFYLRPNYVARKAWQSLRNSAELGRNLRAGKELAGHLLRTNA